MSDAFVEGVRSVGQACHLVILAPVAMMIIAARGRWQAVVGAVAGVTVGGYIFVTRWFIFTDLQLRLSALAVIAGLVVVTLPSVARGDRPEWLARITTAMESPWPAASISAAVGVIVTLWWRPCVGEELGEILTLAPGQPWSQLFPTVGFMIGVSIPLVLLGLAFGAWQPTATVASKLGVFAAAFGVLLSGSVVIGQHGEIVSKLFQWSQ